VEEEIITLKAKPPASDGAAPPPPPALEDVVKKPEGEAEPEAEPAKPAEPAAEPKPAEEPKPVEEKPVTPPPPPPLPPGVVRRSDLTSQIPANATALRETKIQVSVGVLLRAFGWLVLCIECCWLTGLLTPLYPCARCRPAQIPEGASKNFAFAWVCDAKGGLYLSVNKEMMISCGNSTINLAATLNIKGAKPVSAGLLAAAWLCVCRGRPRDTPQQQLMQQAPAWP
jgi:hypothetical protein